MQKKQQKCWWLNQWNKYKKKRFSVHFENECNTIVNWFQFHFFIGLHTFFSTFIIIIILLLLLLKLFGCRSSRLDSD